MHRISLLGALPFALVAVAASSAGVSHVSADRQERGSHSALLAESAVLAVQRSAGDVVGRQQDGPHFPGG